MNTLEMNYRFEPRDPSRRIKGLVIVIAMHAFLGYVLVSGMTRTGLNFMKKPLEAVVIQEVIIPPPPPPPPPPPKKQKEIVKEEPPPFVPPPDVASQGSSTAPRIDSTPTLPTKAPPVIAPPPVPPRPAPPPVPTGPTVASMGVACPTQVPPEMPRKALKDGIEGVVKAQIHIGKGGVIQDVTILSGPRVFHDAVKDAMMQYKCVSDGDVIATQEFNFKLE
jgi:protein TonB